MLVVDELPPRRQRRAFRERAVLVVRPPPALELCHIAHGLGIEARRLADEGGHRGAAEGGGQLDGAALEGHRGRSAHRLCQRRDQRLGQRREILPGRPGLVELEHRELGVVLRRDPLVAEVLVDLEDPLEPADHQPLQKQLGRDPQVQIHPEGVVVGDEGTRRRPARQHLHHRRLHLEEVAVLEEATDEGDDLRPAPEDGAGRFVHEQIDVALAAAQLDVLHPVPLVGEGREDLRREPRLAQLHRQLPPLGDHHHALRPQPVADIETPQQREQIVAHLVAARVQLHAPRPIHDAHEQGAPHPVARHHPPAEGDVAVRDLVARLQVAVLGAQLLGGVRDAQPRRVGIDPLVPQRRELFEEVGIEGVTGGPCALRVVCHHRSRISARSSSSMNRSAIWT